MNVPSGPISSLWRHGPFLHYFTSRSLSEFTYQIAAVAVGWQIYALTHSALDLGLAGLVQFAPSVLFMLPAGHAADRYPRNRVVLVCSISEAMAAAYLAWSSYAGHITVGAIYAALAVFGIAGAFDSPASAALLPAVTSEEQLGLSLSSAALIGTMKMRVLERVTEPSTPMTLFAGVIFVWRKRPILGTISLDLFAVLLGGATALLPIYASDILHTGAWGLGVLRAVPSLGALGMTVMLARHAITKGAGVKMFQAVIVFGAATVVFGVSRQLWLSMMRWRSWALPIPSAWSFGPLWCNLPRPTPCVAASVR